jgi:peptide/nickel transport system ATP-binding protein
VIDDIMVMYAGQIVEKGTADEVVLDPLHPYSRGLLGSVIVP